MITRFCYSYGLMFHRNVNVPKVWCSWGLIYLVLVFRCSICKRNLNDLPSGSLNLGENGTSETLNLGNIEPQEQWALETLNIGDIDMAPFAQYYVVHGQRQTQWSVIALSAVNYLLHTPSMILFDKVRISPLTSTWPTLFNNIQYFCMSLRIKYSPPPLYHHVFSS